MLQRLARLERREFEQPFDDLQDAGGFTANIANSNYKSLQISVERKAADVTLLAAYTYSKAIDYTDDDGWASVNWNWGPVFQRNRAAAGFDRTHILQIGWVYELPAGKGKSFAKSGVAAAILGGWLVNGVMSAYTGTPFTVTDSGSLLNAPDNTQTANQINPGVTRQPVASITSAAGGSDPAAPMPLICPPVMATQPPGSSRRCGSRACGTLTWTSLVNSWSRNGPSSSSGQSSSTSLTRRTSTVRRAPMLRGALIS